VPSKQVTVLGRRMALVLPSRHDPRLRLAAVIISLQVLGQAVLGFKVSIAQILVTVAVCAAIEVGITAWRSGVILWPGSALLTGNSVSFILRAAGTRHGDWWSLNGIEFFVLAALAAMASKYLVRPGGKHVYNPSNLGLVACLLIVGGPRVFPQYLWWGPLETPVILALVVIALGAVWVCLRMRMLPMVLAFSVPFGLLVAAVAAGGRCFAATWSQDPICGSAYFTNIALSPELLVFVLFMMSDPKTSPRTTRGRALYGAATALAAVAMLAIQPTEYGIKVAVLASLTISCTVVPLIERWVERRGASEADPGYARPRPVGWRLSLGPAEAACALIAVAALAGVIVVAGDKRIIEIENRGPSAGVVSQ
jgi:hypothetical protein